MLKELKFVQGAVSKKDLLPAMTHFRIEKNTVRSYNGSIALSSPIPFDIDCVPKADMLVRAISNCNDTITLSMIGNRLRVQSGAFRAFIDCIEGETPHVEPEGEIVNFDGAVLLKAVQTMMPFVGDDASRPWTNGILFKGQSAFATNNVTVIEYWLGVEVPFVINVPRNALKEMLRINEPPTHAQIHNNSITFHYSDQRWIRTQLLVTTWPEFTKILDVESNPAPVHPKLFEGLEVLKGFGDELGRVYYSDGVLRTQQEGDIGASYDIEGFNSTGCFQIAMLLLLKGVATHVDFDLYPKPCLFFGDRLRGAIMGLQM
jgi:DNA polymerase III sliding clamp (beta) subunit (PCNA family)